MPDYDPPDLNDVPTAQILGLLLILLLLCPLDLLRLLPSVLRDSRARPCL